MHAPSPLSAAILCLIVLSSTMAIPLGSPITAVAVNDLETGSQGGTSADGASSDGGLSTVSHVMTAVEMEELKATVGVFDGSTGNAVLATGLRAPTDEEWEAMVGNVTIVDRVSLTKLKAGTSVDLSTSEYFPAIGNQGSLGSCGAWAETYYALGYLVAKAHNWTEASLGYDRELLSPLWTYDLQNGGADLGSPLGGNAQVARGIGVATMATMPYQTSATVWGGEEAWREAAAYQAEAYHMLSYDAATEVSAIKALLSSEVPVVFSLYASDFAYHYADGKGNKNNIISSAEYSGLEPDHAQTIVGYYDNMSDGGEQGVFKVANSWGSGWGDGGYYYITYAAFLKTMANDGEAGYLTLEEDETSALAVWHFDLAPGKDAGIAVSAVSTVSGKTLGTVEPYIHAYTAGYATIYPMTYFMCLDISKLSAYLGRADVKIMLEVGTSVIAYSSGDDPSLSSFRVEQYSGTYRPGDSSTISSQAMGLPATIPCEVAIAQGPLDEISTVNALDWNYPALSYAGTAQWVGVGSGNGSESSMQSGDVGDRSASMLVAFVDGPGTLIFDWKVSSEPECDMLRFYVDGELREQIAGEQGWSRGSFTLPSGLHNLTWSYEKDNYVSQGEDCGWLDNVEWTGLAVVRYLDFEGTMAGVELTDANAASGTDTWGTAVQRSNSGSFSAWCAASGSGGNGHPNNINGQYDASMLSYMTWAMPAMSATTHLSFHYWSRTDAGLTDHLYVEILTAEGWETAWVQPAGTSSGWESVQITLDHATAVRFCFVSDASGGDEGAYLDDVLLTRADIEAPASHVLPLPSYINSTATLVQWNVTDGASAWEGTVQIFYRAPGADGYVLYTTPSNPSGRWNGTTAAFDLEEVGGTEGTYTFYSLATDLSGNVEIAPVVPDATTVYDVTAPSTRASTSGKAAPSWNANAVTVTLTADDDTSGVAQTRYRVDGGTWSTYIGELLLGTEGGHTVQFFSVDAAGNAEAVRSITVNIDLSTPVVSITSPLAGERSCTGTVTWSASDLSGIAQVELSSDGVSWTVVTGSSAQLELEAGPCTAYLRVTDMAGLIRIVTVSFVHDPVPPALSFTAPAMGSHLNSGDVSVSWTASDDLSSMDRFEVSVDGGPWTAVSTNDIHLNGLQDGAHTVRVRAYDAAGNVQEKAISFTVDTLFPVAVVTPTGADVDITSSVVVRFSEPMDMSSAIVQLDGVDAGMIWSGNEARCISALQYDGVYSVHVFGTDLAGNALEQNWTFSTVRTGSMSGTLIDANGHPLANITVGLSNGLRTVTDGEGHFTFTSLAPGSYTVTVHADGFDTFATDMAVVSGEDTAAGTTTLYAVSAGMPYGLVMVLVIALVVAALAIIVMMRRKR